MYKEPTNKREVSMYILGIGYAIFLLVLNLIRIFDNTYWKDEFFTINLVGNNLGDIIDGTAEDVHPPLYYLIVKLFISILGEHDWVFRLASLIPCIIILIISLTWVWKNFGKIASVILITLATISPNAVEYNMDVRMYSWGNVFVFLSFCSLYMLLEYERNKDYVLFGLFSLLAAYTHYFCLVTVAFFYMALIVRLFFRRKEIRRVVLLCIGTIVGYIPWLMKMSWAKASPSVATWQRPVPSYLESVNFIYSELFEDAWAVLILGIVVVALLYETNILEKVEESSKRIKIRINYRTPCITNTFLWITIGVGSILWTIFVGKVLSDLLKPIFIERYLYPATVIAWLCLGILVSKLKGRVIFSSIIILYLWRVCIPDYMETYEWERECVEKLQMTLRATVDEIEIDDVIIMDSGKVGITTTGFYYPGVPYEIMDIEEMSTLESERCYWLIRAEDDLEKEDLELLDKQGVMFEKVVDEGCLGDHEVYIYKVRR